MTQRKSGHVTLTDVALSAGFAVSTVSIVLSEAPLSKNISVATREHIRKTAARLGYHPDAFARSLRKRTSQTIGVLAFDLSDPFCMPIFGGIQSGLQPTGYLPLVLDAQTQRKLLIAIQTSARAPSGRRNRHCQLGFRRGGAAGRRAEEQSPDPDRRP
jgi:LacI family transcriptional regulator